MKTVTATGSGRSAPGATTTLTTAVTTAAGGTPLQMMMTGVTTTGSPAMSGLRGRGATATS